MSSCTTSTLRMFPYQKLDTETTIRLIQVLPILGDDKIVCEIRTVDTNKSPGVEYYALSYVWGDAKPTREILLENIETNRRYVQPLHENLWQFLYQIWKQERDLPAKRASPLLIWTDALCLNQGDNQEKAQQIPRMGAIYSQAEIVLAWLGSDADLQNELQLVREFWDTVGFYEAFKIPGYDATGSYSSCKLAKHPYWRRTWIVQEIVLAHRPHIMAGDTIIEFSKLQTQLMLNDMNRPSYESPWTIAHNWLKQIIDLRAAEKAKKRMPLWQIVKELSSNEKSKIADAIYGILGLVGDHSDGTSPKEHIGVDYGKSTLDIFFDTIFEIRAPLKEYPTLIEELNNLILREKSYNIDIRPLDAEFPLEKYLKERTTSDRHRDLATSASRVNDAMRMLLVHLSPRHENNEDSPSPFSFQASRIFNKDPLTQPDIEQLTLGHHAAVVGFFLAACGYTRVEEFIFDDLEQDKPHPPVPGPSPWRCSVHRNQQHNPIPEYIGPWQAKLSFWSSSDLVAVCGEHCGSCDVSYLVFEMLEIGFFVHMNVVESASPFWKDGILSIGFFDPVSHGNG